jgi:hypothetical protein
MLLTFIDDYIYTDSNQERERERERDDRPLLTYIAVSIVRV